MGATCDLKLVLRIVDKATNDKFLSVLQNLMTSGELTASLPRYRVEIARRETEKQAMDSVRHHLAVGENRAAILLFDIGADPVNGSLPIDSGAAPLWIEGAHDAFKSRCATIAIMQNTRRLRNVDRVIGRAANSEQLLDALKLVTDRLSYTACPEKRTLTAQPEVRLIRRQHELLDYFKLRHRIYKIMGYLEEDIENAPSQMEINWCDKIALHIGAYARISEQHESLVGTARVVVGTAADARKTPGLLASYDQWITTLASQDPVLQQALNKGVLPLQLPIFQSQHLSKIFREALQRNEVCGELSRVIVREDYRGTGLSNRLVEFALAEAEKVGVNRIFLECLDIHESLYRRMGFKRIQGTPGTVISVNQTMIGMELSRPLGTPIARAASYR